jgi:(R,R)-butanediol dehydrogenase/meso-butanediol dehydrogenase/diacetyl reductase
MRAGLYLSEKKVSVGELEKPSLSKNQALIKVSYAGICGTDMMIYSGKHPRAKAPLAMGHEFSGVIEEIIGESGFTVGERVVVEPTISCGQCKACVSGQTHVCKQLRLIGIDLHGGFAEYVAVPLDRLHLIPDELPEAMAALAEPLAVAVHTVRKSNLKVGDDVVILGAGPIGLLIGLIAKRAGANQVIVSDISPYRIAKAQELGFIAMDARKGRVIEETMDLTNGDGADIVFEVAGSQETAEHMVDLAKIQGQIVVVSIFKTPPVVNLAKMHFREISLMTTRCYSGEDFKTAIQMMAKEEIDVTSIISHQLLLDEIEKGFSLMAKPDESLKILIQP